MAMSDELARLRDLHRRGALNVDPLDNGAQCQSALPRPFRPLIHDTL